MNEADYVDFGPDEIVHLPRDNKEPETGAPTDIAAKAAYRETRQRWIEADLSETGFAHSGDVLLQRYMVGLYPSEAGQRN